MLRGGIDANDSKGREEKGTMVHLTEIETHKAKGWAEKDMEGSRRN